MNGLREKMIKAMRLLRRPSTNSRLLAMTPSASLRGARSDRVIAREQSTRSNLAFKIASSSFDELRTPRNDIIGKLFPMLKKWSLSLIIIIVLAAPSKSFGLGLGVDPGQINLQNVPLGKQIAVSKLGGEKMKLSIKNKGSSACTYTINILPTAQTTAVLKEGYSDIPDASWIYPKNKEVRIEGESTKAVELYIKIPKKKEYYNKKYQAVIEVKSKKNSPQELFVLACQLKIFFSTSAGGKNENK